MKSGGVPVKISLLFQRDDQTSFDSGADIFVICQKPKTIPAFNAQSWSYAGSVVLFVDQEIIHGTCFSTWRSQWCLTPTFSYSVLINVDAEAKR